MSLPPESVRYSRGPFAQVVAVRALCSDNRERWARVGIPDSYFSAPARVSVGGRTVSGFVSFSDKGSTFHAGKRGRNARKLPGEHAPRAYWRAVWKAHAEQSLALIYCGPVDEYRSHGIRTAATEGRSMIEHVRPHALANLAWRNVATLAKIHARRHGWNLADCEERRQTPRPVCDVEP
jgi:hypothetical protein